MIYIQHVDRGSMDVDEVIDIVETPEEAADSFEEYMTYPEDYDYNREALIEVLSTDEEAQVLPANDRGTYYILFAHA